MKELNIRIRQKRQECGLTLLEVAERIGVKEATVQRYESGSIKNIKHETICKLAEIFNCSPSWLMGFDIPSRAEFEKASDAIQQGLFSDPTISRDDIPQEPMGDASSQRTKLLHIFDGLDEKKRAQLILYAFDLEAKEE